MCDPTCPAASFPGPRIFSILQPGSRCHLHRDKAQLDLLCRGQGWLRCSHGHFASRRSVPVQPACTVRLLLLLHRSGSSGV